MDNPNIRQMSPVMDKPNSIPFHVQSDPVVSQVLAYRFVPQIKKINYC